MKNSSRPGRDRALEAAALGTRGNGGGGADGDVRAARSAAWHRRGPTPPARSPAQAGFDVRARGVGTASWPPPRKERIAHNESAFRELNESLEASVHRGRPAGTSPASSASAATRTASDDRAAAARRRTRRSARTRSSSSSCPATRRPRPRTSSTGRRLPRRAQARGRRRHRRAGRPARAELSSAAPPAAASADRALHRHTRQLDAVGRLDHHAAGLGEAERAVQRLAGQRRHERERREALGPRGPLAGLEDRRPRPRRVQSPRTNIARTEPARCAGPAAARRRRPRPRRRAGGCAGSSRRRRRSRRRPRARSRCRPR